MRRWKKSYTKKLILNQKILNNFIAKFRDLLFERGMRGLWWRRYKGEANGINVHNNPINFTDPSGLGAISDAIQEDLENQYGDSLDPQTREEMGDIIEQTAKELDLDDDLIKNALNPFKSKKAKEKTKQEITEKIEKELRKKAKNDQRLKELEEKLKELEDEKKRKEKPCDM